MRSSRDSSRDGSGQRAARRPRQPRRWARNPEAGMRYAAGVDVGSTQTKAVIVDSVGRLTGRSLIPTGANVIQAANQAFQEALDSALVREADVGFVIGTGYGR